MNGTDLKNITLKVTTLAKSVGSFIRTEGHNFDLNRIEYKGKNDMVSYVDKESEKLLVAGLKVILPEAGFITEEATEQINSASLCWVIDPLDGTTNFLHGLPPFSISIALMENNVLMAGVVYEVTKDECFYAWKDGGAFCNEKSIRVSPINTLNKSLIVTGFPYSLLDKETAFFEIMKDFVRNTHGMRRLGSAAVDLSYVACGRFEAYYEFNLNIWDVAAGILILQEAGGKVTDFSGGNKYLDGSEILACGSVHAEALAVIQKYW